MEEGRRHRRRPRHLAGRQGQLLGDGRDRPVRPVQRDPLPAERRHPVRRRGGGRQVPGPACDCDRWVEIWNLVFMQFEQVGPATAARCPSRRSTRAWASSGCAPCCRACARTTRRISPAAHRARRALSGKTFDPSDYAGTSVSLRAIADHARAAAFLIADGVFPDKTGREYVLRRIMRRARLSRLAARHQGAVPARDAGDVIKMMGGVYPELRERASLINKAASTRRRASARRSIAAFASSTTDARRAREAVPGELAFKLYDTFGFPLDLTRVIAEQHGFDVDKAGFDARWTSSASAASSRARARSRSKAVFQAIAERVGATKFLGYQATAAGRRSSRWSPTARGRTRSARTRRTSRS